MPSTSPVRQPVLGGVLPTARHVGEEPILVEILDLLAACAEVFAESVRRADERTPEREVHLAVPRVDAAQLTGVELPDAPCGKGVDAVRVLVAGSRCMRAAASSPA